MAITLDKINRIIEVEAPDTSVTIQQLINAIRNWEDDLVNFETAKIADASGKDDLGGGALVGITLKFLNWKLKFEDRVSATVCNVSGGNLVAVDANNVAMYAIAPAANVTVILAQSTSPSLVAEWTQSDIASMLANRWNSIDISAMVTPNSIGKKLVDVLKLKRVKP